MKYEWDAAKSASNAKKHGCAFEIVSGFDWTEAVEVLDDRFDYGESAGLRWGPSARSFMRWRSHRVAMTRCA